MKKLTTVALLFISVQSFAQDTATVRNLPIQARLAKYLAPRMANIEIDSLYTPFLNLRAKFRVPNPPTGTTNVTIDSIPTVELANLYRYTMSNSEGMGAGLLMRTQISTARAGNPYLNRLCTAVEAEPLQRFADIIAAGGKLLMGK